MPNPLNKPERVVKIKLNVSMHKAFCGILPEKLIFVSFNNYNAFNNRKLSPF